MVFKLDHSCFCADLKLGSLIFSYLHLIKDLVQIFVSAFILYTSLVNRNYYYYYRFDIPIAFSATFLTFGFINIVFTILLLNGLNQRKPAYVLAFLIYGGISTVIYFLIGLVLICLSEIFIVLVPGLIYLVLYIYFLLVIRSFYPKVDNAEMKAVIFSTPAVFPPFVTSNYVHSQI